MNHLTDRVTTYQSRYCRHTTINLPSVVHLVDLVGNNYLIFIDSYNTPAQWTLLRLTPVLIRRILDAFRAPITDTKHQIKCLSIEYAEFMGSGEHDGYRLSVGGACAIIELQDKIAFMYQLENEVK